MVLRSALTLRRLEREAHVSTSSSQAGPQAWVPPSHVDPGWPSDCELPSTQGPTTAQRLIDSCRSRADFVALRRGRRFDSEFLWLSFAADPQLTRPRVAFAIRRSSGTAVARNLARRRLRAVLLEHADTLKRGRYLVGTKRPLQAVTYSRARAQLLALLRNAGALAPPRAESSL